MSKIKNILIIILIVIILAFAAIRFLPPIIGNSPASDEDESASPDIPIVIRVEGGTIEVASVTGKRHFSGANDPTIMGQRLPFCRETAAWNAEYKITYRIKLGEKWPIKYQGGRLKALVPELEPSLPIAIDTRTLAETGLSKCWLMWNLNTRTRVLKGISADLEKLANQPGTKKFAREAAIETLREFIRTWAFNQKQYLTVSPDAPIDISFQGD